MAGRIYVVKAGDSLSKIAKEVYGDAKRWKEIYEANKDKIKNPDVIHPGQELVIPEAASAAAQVKDEIKPMVETKIEPHTPHDEPAKGLRRRSGEQAE